MLRNLKKLFFLSLNFLLWEIVFSQNVTVGTNYLEYGFGRFDHPSSYQVFSSNPLGDDGFTCILGNNAGKAVWATFSTGNWEFPSAVEDVYKAFVVGSNNVTASSYEYFTTSKGYVAGLVHVVSELEVTVLEVTSTTTTHKSYVWVELTKSNDSDSKWCHLDITGVDSIDELKSLADGADNLGSGTTTPAKTLSELQSIPAPTQNPIVTVGTNYLEYGFGRFDHPSSYQVFSSNPLGDDGFTCHLGNNAGKGVWATFSTGNWEFPSAVEDMYNSSVVGSNNITSSSFEYFTTSKGYYAGLVHIVLGNVIYQSYVWVELTKSNDSDSKWCYIDIQGVDSIDELKSLADGATRKEAISSSSDNENSTDGTYTNDDNGSTDAPTSSSGGNSSKMSGYDGLIVSGNKISNDYFEFYDENWGTVNVEVYPVQGLYKSPSYLLSIHSVVDVVEGNIDGGPWYLDDYAIKYENHTPFFTTQGFPAIVYEKTAEYTGNKWFVVEIDGSTSSSPADTQEWFRVQLILSELNEEPTEAEAISIANKIVFKHGQSSPRKNLPQWNTNPTDGTDANDGNGSSDVVSTDLSASLDLSVSSQDSGWFYSDWLGIFYHCQNGWIYHEDLQWLYWTGSDEGSWFWAEKKDWLWTAKYTYPYLYSDNTDSWVYLSISAGEEPKAYDYSTNSWATWNDLILVNQATAPQNNPNTEEQAIFEIFNSNSMTEEEKIDAIAKIILLGL